VQEDHWLEKRRGGSSVRHVKGKKLESAAHLEVPPRRGKNQDRITIDKLWENPDRVAEACLISDVIACQVVTSNNLFVQQRVVLWCVCVRYMLSGLNDKLDVWDHCHGGLW
jgi:hypothetical protein